MKTTRTGQPLDLNAFARAASAEGFCLLHSAGGGMETETRTIVGLKPRASVSSFGEARGLGIGYLAYPGPGLSNTIPDRRFYDFDSLLVYDRKDHRFSAFGDLAGEFRLDADPAEPGSFSTNGPLEVSFTRKEYLEKIGRVKALLRAGEIYQLNFALRFRKRFSGDPYALFLRLAEENPADFMAFINAGDFQIVSASPERLLKADRGVLITQPIKGTVSKAGGSPNLRRLVESKKERAELDMITDLERNDVGKLCEYGTLELVTERGVLELPNLWHCYSEVRGRLKPGTTSEAVMEAMFPGGSITGCPKKRAMEYISSLEGLPRNCFTGSVGYFSGSGLMDFNIAIRTALIKDGFIEFWAGGGIVMDSDPEAEYDELMLKVEKFLKIL